MQVNLSYPQDFPIQAKDLVNKLLKKNPASRITIKQMKEHPWFFNEQGISLFAVQPIEPVQVQINSSSSN